MGQMEIWCQTEPGCTGWPMLSLGFGLKWKPDWFLAWMLGLNKDQRQRGRSPGKPGPVLHCSRLEAMFFGASGPSASTRSKPGQFDGVAVRLLLPQNGSPTTAFISDMERNFKFQIICITETNWILMPSQKAGHQILCWCPEDLQGISVASSSIFDWCPLALAKPPELRHFLWLSDC